MQDYQIVAGFSEIKLQFRMKANLNKSLDEFHLWFSFEEGILFVHDFDDHGKNMALAIYSKQEAKWWVVFRGKSYGREVIEFGIHQAEKKDAGEALYDLYLLYGYTRL